MRSLSTPHGALGTRMRTGIGCLAKKLSTPHGALGTYNGNVKGFPRVEDFQLHTVH